jgi:bifunctional DNase/RNase
MKCQESGCQTAATLHVTLVRAGGFKEFHLCDQHFLERQSDLENENRKPAPTASGPAGPNRSGLVRFEIDRVVISETEDRQGIFLREARGGRTLGVGVGIFEATALDRQLKRMPSPRPLTHDITVAAIEALEGRGQEVVVYDYDNATYYTTLNVQQAARSVSIHMRISDALIVGVICDLPVWVAEKVLSRSPEVR